MLPASHISRAITKISTEYRLQFAWPRRQHQLTNGEAVAPASQPPRDESTDREIQQRKPAVPSLRQSSTAPAPAPVHRRRQPATLEQRCV